LSEAAMNHEGSSNHEAHWRRGVSLSRSKGRYGSFTVGSKYPDSEST